MIEGLEPWAREAIGVGAGFAIGALVGLERGFKLRGEKDGTRVAGFRTFSLLGLGAGLSGRLSLDQPAAGAVLLLGMVALLAWAYGPRLKDHPDATSPVAALAVTAASFSAGTGAVGLALASGAMIVFILASRDPLHRFVDRLDQRDIQALARFAVIALAVLPFLPETNFGPYQAWNAATLWWVVVLVTGFSFAGYIANRLFGARHGTMAIALIGGAYSSTAVTQSLAQRVGAGASGGAEQAGIALATATMYLRVIVLVAVLSPRFLIPFAVLLAPALVVAWVAGWWLYRSASPGKDASPPGNPIALMPALFFVLFLAVAAVGARWAEGRFGEQGIAILLFLMGSLGIDAAIVTAGGLPPEAIGALLGAIALGGTIIANMAVKIGITLAYARKDGLRAAAALAASTLVLAASLAVGWTRF